MDIRGKKLSHFQAIRSPKDSECISSVHAEQYNYKYSPLNIDTLIPARRKGVDGFNVETPGLLTDPVPISPSSDYLTDAWAPTVHKLCHNQASCGSCSAQFLCLLTVQQQFYVW
ncbi:hypothetical protein AVEN_109594-1 [Araneus ventricosus]|uniref:Uncharacterized protein n=1 Tax=Araneus ventricosus TaxID=182803 RepID=A0A4Y2LPZ7_ARAVE|nr:hypothetical protein AVEN_109594-1 [Araneus ventricosus]